jgi:thiamine biosynthesis lipoprotein ApbE
MRPRPNRSPPPATPPAGGISSSPPTANSPRPSPNSSSTSAPSPRATAWTTSPPSCANADYEHFLVEIGGETLAEGLNADGEPWRVGVLLPDDSGNLHGVIQATGGRAVATSGDYRNFFRDADGRIQSHIIDPRTAAPAGHAVASVSVLAADCLTADALATALLVLGHEEGLPLLASSFPNVEALFILRSPDREGFAEVPTPGFAAALHYEH